jgi:chaperonin GroES
MPKIWYIVCMKKKQKKPAAKKVAKKTPILKVKIAVPKNSVGIAPLHDRILVKPLSADEKTTSFGLIIPDAAKEKPEQGTVVAVGPGKRAENGSLIAPSVKAGDKILFSKYGFDEIKVNGVEYYMLSESSILAILN